GSPATGGVRDRGPRRAGLRPGHRGVQRRREEIDRLLRAAQGGPAPLVHGFGLNLDHAHVPEGQRRTGLRRPRLFVPWVGHFRGGMLVCIPLHRDWLRAAVTSASVRELLRERYAGERLVSVRTRGGLAGSITLSEPMGCGVELYAEGNNDHL